MRVARAEESDLTAITEIYNQAVLHSTATFDTEPRSMAEQREWFGEHTGLYPVFVAKASHGPVMGWSSLSPWSARKAYSITAESSVYVAEGFRRAGVGRVLMEAVVQFALSESRLHTLLARIAGENEASVALHKGVGFDYVGTMREVGWKFGALVDVHLYQNLLRR